MEEHEDGRAGNREGAQQQREAWRQCSCRNQHRSEKQKRERVLQSAGKEEQDRQLGRIESQQPPRTVRLETLPQRKPGTHGDVEPCRERNHRETSPHRQLEVEPPIDHQHGRCLSDYGEPAQADKGVKAHAAPGLMR
jgi:hypothetical protein